MPTTFPDFTNRLSQIGEWNAVAVPEIVDAVLSSARDAGASDVHLVPREDGLEMSWRIDGTP